MSLINEVLRDLDARHAAASEMGNLPPPVRALPTARQSPLQRAAVPLLAAALGGGLVWLWLQGRPLAEGPVASPAAVPAPVAIVPEAPVPVAPAAGETAATEAAVEAVAPPPLTSFKLDDAMASPPVERAAPSPRPTSVAKLAADKISAPATPATAVPADKVVARTATAKPAAQHTPQISKQPTGGAVTTAAELAEGEYRRGLAASRRGAPTEAGDAFRAALKAQPTHVPARQALLAQLVEQRQWQSVEVVALDGLVAHPTRHDWALLTARVQHERGELPQALETLTQYAASAKQNADYQVFHALLLQRAQRHAEAVTAYQAALALRPAEGRWWYGLGRALDADHRENEARSAYEKARDSGALPPDLQQQVEKRLGAR